MPDIVIALFILAAFFVVLAVGAWIADREPDKPRKDQKIDPRERELLGEDWRDHILTYADTKHERWNAIRGEVEDD